MFILTNILLKTQKTIVIIACLGVLLCQNAFSQHQAKEFSSEVATAWYNLQLFLIPNTTGFSPPVASRALGYTGLTLYESVVNGMPDYQSLTGVLNEFKTVPRIESGKNYHWVLCANAAQASIIKSLYASTSKANLLKIDSLKGIFERKYLNDVDKETALRSIKLGEAIAKAVFDYSKTDGGHEGYNKNFPKDYKVTTGACAWTPTGEQSIPLQPYWGHNRTFVKGDADFELPTPPRCEASISSVMYAQALEVYSTGKNLSSEQTTIARYWSDDAGKTFTPPGHAIAITSQIIAKENLRLDKAAEIYCKVGIAAADAFISCWKCKFMHNVLRPVSYIRTTIDRNWNPLLDTPPFPEYTSGHASVSGATAQVLSDFFGFNYHFTDNAHAARGFKPRSFESFYEFAEEAALSRMYGGIHYRNSNEQGLKNGKRIGKNVCELKFKSKGA
ncbi:vanadium-dependent haloperoxidase [Emticicia sp. SJ17W-69]|uniref:vanadium-dependent haloperoxidase n=1 Tax=Emticicia sp. SJ17W-69 TaxID=3421657 RepID=UPI003EBCFF5B